jgi:hypothetical protein
MLFTPRQPLVTSLHLRHLHEEALLKANVPAAI